MDEPNADWPAGLMVMPRTPIKKAEEAAVDEDGGVVEASVITHG